MHRAGASLNVHVHFHVLCLDGVYLEAEEKRGTRSFEAAPAPAREDGQLDIQGRTGRVGPMADVVFGGTLRYMIGFKMMEPRPAFSAYAERIAARPALQRSEARNAAIRQERGLDAK